MLCVSCSCSHGPEEYEYCSQHDELPPDDVYHWAAFNKLLLLGMYAPVEEAHAGPRQVPLVRQQLHQLAAARVVSMRVLVHRAHAGQGLAR